MRQVHLLLALIVCVGPAQGQVAPLFARWNSSQTPGAAVAVLYRGQLVHEGHYGLANLEHAIHIDSETVFDIGSVSKQFCAFAVALLVADGRVSLDESIRTYIPELSALDHTISVRHLVHHTSGLRDWPGILAFGGKRIEDVITLEEVFQMAANQHTLNFEPGSEYLYSNTGYSLLAVLVERVSGQSLAEFAAERIFGPLQMTQTHFVADREDVVRNRAFGYAPATGRYIRLGNGLMAPGASSLLTSLRDMIRWTRNFSSQTVGAPEVHALMNRRGVLSSRDTIAYAFGNLVGAYRGLRTVWHNGAWTGFRAALLRIPDHDFAVIILGNTAGMNPIRLAEQTAEVYLEAFMDPAPEPPTTADMAVSPGDYTGVYDVNAANVLRIEPSLGALALRLGPAAVFPMQPTGPAAFYVAPLSATLEFERDTTGAVTHLRGFGLRTPRRISESVESVDAYPETYVNTDLGVSYRVHLQRDTLRVQGPRGQDFALHHVIGDVFWTDQWYMPVVRFFRDSSGAITHFEANNARSLRVRFTR